LAVLSAHEIAHGDDGGRRLAVVFFDSEGNLLAPEDLAKTSGTIRWEIRFLGEHNREAKRLHDEGRAVGARQDYDRAIALLTQAAELDPSWPYPIYDRAFSHLLKQEFALALSDYRRTLELAPRGFFMARQTTDMLEREAAGEFPAGLSVGVAILPDMPKEQQQAIAEQLVEKFPTCPAGWAMHANLLTDPAACLTAIENGLAARPDSDTRGTLLVRKAWMLERLGQTDRALDILEALTDPLGDSISTYGNAYIALSLIRGRHSNPS
jgi:tetratricopeptide (TPR) repeat protein